MIMAALFTVAKMEKQSMYSLTGEQISKILDIHIIEFYSALKRKKPGMVAHICNSSYSGGRDEEDHSSNTALANSLRDPTSKIPNTKQGW
jgi:hypothetical protein